MLTAMKRDAPPPVVRISRAEGYCRRAQAFFTGHIISMITVITAVRAMAHSQLTPLLRHERKDAHAQSNFASRHAAGRQR